MKRCIALCAFLTAALFALSPALADDKGKTTDKRKTPPIQRLAKTKAKDGLVVQAVRHKGKKGKRKSPFWRVMARFHGTKMVVNYARPSKRGRTIFGGLVPFGKVWRTGANEATTFQMNKTITFGGKTLKPGTYALFTLPGKKSWSVILNNKAKQWGAYSYDEKFDVVRVKAKVGTGKLQEQFTITFAPSKGKKVFLVMMWDTAHVKVPIVVR